MGFLADIYKSFGSAVVMIPMWQKKFVLVKQFRHALGRFQYAFPRGFGEDDKSVIGNAVNEMREELGCTLLDAKPIGTVVADSGLALEEVHALLCEIDEPQDTYDEGIVEHLVLSELQLQRMMSRGEIDDGFTLSAFALYQAWQRTHAPKKKKRTRR